MKISKTILFILISISTFAQNLLVNGDFEDFTVCPIGYSNPGQFPNYELTKCVGWNIPTYGTSDYYNYCADGTFAGINTNSHGYQIPKSGNAYLGAFFYNSSGGAGWDGYSGPMWWEYVQGQIVNELEHGKIYKISFYVSLAEYSDLMIKEFGAYFSDTTITSQNSASLNLNPQIKFQYNDFIADTTNWILAEGIYFANGGEKYIIIGNFKSDQTTDTLRRYSLTNLNIPNPMVSYFFIDNAELNDVTNEFEFQNVFSPNNDGLNDLWSLPIGLYDYTIKIFNRWGEEIIQSEANEFTWDGTLESGKQCTEGVYYFLLSNKLNTNNYFKGVIHLYK